MKTKFTFWRSMMAGLLLAVTAVACNQKTELEPLANNGKHLISFNVVDGAATRGAITESIKEFWVYATDSKGEVVLDGVRYASVDGQWKADEDCFSNDPALDFYVYTPSVTREGTAISYEMSEDVTAQPDLMTAVVEDVNPANGAITLEFDRALALIQFKVSGDSDYSLESIEMSNIIAGGSYDIKAAAWTTNDVSASAYPAGIKDGINKGGNGTLVTDATGYLMVVPQTASPLISVVNSNGTQKDYDDLTDKVWEAGKLYTYTIGIDEIEAEDESGVKDPTDDYTNKKSSNCYIINPTASAERVYHFPVEERVNDYWGNYAGVEANKVNGDLTGLTIEQLWSDCDAATALEVTPIIDANGKVAMQVVVPAGYSNMGNELYAVKKNGVIVWSWHLWVTDYAPTADRLNRYVGQMQPTSIKGALLYQFGRKDPFKGTARVSNSSATIKTGVLNPETAYSASQYDWASDFNRSVYWGDEKLKSAGKSIFDPSPYGYRVADYAHMKQYNDLGDFEISGSYYIDTWYNTYFCFTTGFATNYGPITNKEARVWMSNPTSYSMGNNASTYRMYDYTSLYGAAYVFETSNYVANAFFPVFSIED